MYIGTQCFITLFNSSGLKLWGFLIGFPFSPIIKKLLPDSKERCDADLSTITASLAASKVVKLSSNPSGLSSPTLLLFSVATTADFVSEDSAAIMLPKASSFPLLSTSTPLVWFCYKNFKY